MRIFIDDSIFEKQRVGGISRYFCELIAELAQLPDIEVVLYVGKSSNVYLESLEECPSVRVVRFQNRWHLPKRMFAFFSSLIRKFCFFRQCHGADSVIYHASYYDLDALIAKYADATVITVHDLIYETLNDDFRPNKIAKRKRIQNQADRILTVSESTAVDLEAFNPTTAAKIDVTELAAAMLDEGAPTITLPGAFFLFVGIRKDYKQGELALRAFHALRNSDGCEQELMFVGGGPFSKQELALIDTLDLAQHVTQINLSDAELRDAYAKATALVFPSDYEGFGLPVLEAIHYECPVIAQAVSSIPAVGGEWPIYFDPAEVGSLTRAMAWVRAEGRERIAQDRSAARAHQIEQFSWPKTAAKTLASYKRALESTGSLECRPIGRHRLINIFSPTK